MRQEEDDIVGMDIGARHRAMERELVAERNADMLVEMEAANQSRNEGIGAAARRPFGHAQRGPRFAHAEIIDLSEETPQRAPAQQHHFVEPSNLNQGRPAPVDARWVRDGRSSPEIQFLRARAISPRVRYAGATPPATRAPNRLNHAGRVAPIEIPDDDGDDIQIIRESIRHPSPPPAMPAGLGRSVALDNLLGIIGNTARMFAGVAGSGVARPGPAHTAAARARARRMARNERLVNFIPPNLDFGVAAFDLGYAPPDVPVREREPSPIPELGPAPEGFTRSPAEQDVAVCPGCGDELCVGGDARFLQPP